MNDACFFLAIILVVACATGVAADPLQEAVAAFLSEDYAWAVRLFRPLTEQGHADAQFFLGGLYANGQGVPQIDQEALKWCRKAAEQGNAAVQFNLGLMYAKGQGVPQDFVRAHMWPNLAGAALGGDDGKPAMKNRDFVASEMTAAQIEKAHEMAWRCQNTKFKECD